MNDGNRLAVRTIDELADGCCMVREGKLTGPGMKAMSVGRQGEWAMSVR